MLQAQAVYDSVWHIPVSAWVGSVVGILLARHRRGFARVYGVAFALASALDAWLNGPLTPLASGGLAATVSGIVFVILGDLRFFVASERLERGAAARWLTPLAWSLLVPVLCEVVRRAVPAIAANERATFLSYELLFLPVALYFRRRAARRARRASSLAAFEVIQYALWVLADVLILSHATSVGYLLRLVPNVMYYVAFVPFALAALRDAE